MTCVAAREAVERWVPKGLGADYAKLANSEGKSMQEQSASLAALSGELAFLAQNSGDPRIVEAGAVTARIGLAAATIEFGVGTVLRVAGSFYLAHHGDVTPLVQTSLSVADYAVGQVLDPALPVQTPGSLENLAPKPRCP